VFGTWTGRDFVYASATATVAVTPSRFGNNLADVTVTIRDTSSNPYHSGSGTATGVQVYNNGTLISGNVSGTFRKPGSTTSEQSYRVSVENGVVKVSAGGVAFQVF
jgi:hypothetical protein